MSLLSASGSGWCRASGLGLWLAGSEDLRDRCGQGENGKEGLGVASASIGVVCSLQVVAADALGVLICQEVECFMDLVVGGEMAWWQQASVASIRMSPGLGTHKGPMEEAVICLQGKAGRGNA